MEAGFPAYFGFVFGHADAFRLLFGGGRQPDEEFAAIAERVEEAMAGITAGLIDVALDPEHRRLLGHAVVGLAEGTEPPGCARASPPIPPGWPPGSPTRRGRDCADSAPTEPAIGDK